MEQTALRPKPMPGQGAGDGAKSDPGARRPYAAPRRCGRRLTTLLVALIVGTVLVLSGVGLGTVGATVIGMSKLAELQRQAGQGAPGSPVPSADPGASAPSTPTPTSSQAPAAVATLGVEAVDAEKVGALIVGVHVPGPGYAAGLIRGDLVLAFDRTRVDSAADLARAVAEARPGSEVTLTVRHRSGGYQQLTVVPGVVT
ncbi:MULTISPECIES: PDZ domain-containing protein [unclassified Streptomyces]|uniref:PDZ domain-containing protein n=1 Tax=unclassified Streptomyces TaxID=2593676 RepID=UPI002366BB1D|nr:MULTISPECIES: PDZ domain-containing protein [unclassified Streptomyces]MDF3144960.1 PDZ domain-containing protein [Streptomyces sp. T21Q-yed]WDF42182.1 PDZ domain-containing protein [Streptomyces sp. T12]